MADEKIYPGQLDEDFQQVENILPTEEMHDIAQPEFEVQDRQEDEDTFETLRKVIKEDPHNIDNYIAMIDQCKLLGKADLICQVREEAYKCSVLTLDMWKNWLSDAHNNATSFKEKVEVLRIYESALSSFNYYEIAKDYIWYAYSLLMDNENDGSFTIDNAERAFKVGSRIWRLDFGKSFEFWQLLLKLQTEIKPLASSEAEESKEVKENKLRGFYEEKLAIPTLDLEEIWEGYEKWEKDKTKVPQMKTIFNNTLAKMDKRMKFEDSANYYLSNINTTEGNLFIDCRH